MNIIDWTKHKIAATFFSMVLAIAPDAGAAPMQFMSVSPQFPQIVDSGGNWWRFRGVNYTLIEHAHVGVVQQTDVDKIASMGFNVIRFPINWSLLEPTPGVIDWGYVSQITSLVEMAQNDNIYVIIVMAQWNTSQCFNALYGNGFPTWFVQDLIGDGAHCSDEPGADGKFSDAQKASENQDIQNFWNVFWNNPAIPLSYASVAGYGNTAWDAYASIWRLVAWQLRNYPNVLAWDIMNEPEPGSAATNNDVLLNMLNSTTLPLFYGYVGTRIRWSDWADQYGNQNHILAFEGFEGSSDPNLGLPQALLGETTTLAGMALPNVALAPHAYVNDTATYQASTDTVAKCSLAHTAVHVGLDWANPAIHGNTHNVPVIFGEFGLQSTSDASFSSDPQMLVGLEPELAENMTRIIGVNGQSWIWFDYEPGFVAQDSGTVTPGAALVSLVSPYDANGLAPKDIQVPYSQTNLQPDAGLLAALKEYMLVFDTGSGYVETCTSPPPLPPTPPCPTCAIP